MKGGEKFSNLIYEYFITRIRFQYYSCGDTLPSIDTMCSQFGVSSQTVMDALRRMRSEGFISMGNGMITKVIFKQTNQEFEEYTRRFFSMRWNAQSDLFQSAELIFIPLLTEGCLRMDQSDLERLSVLAESCSSDDLILFYWNTLQKLDNPLAVNLLWESSLFHGFPYVRENTPVLYDQASFRRSLKEIIDLAGQGNRAGVYNGFLEFQRINERKRLGYFGQTIVPVPKERQLSFSWRIYRERPQLCSTMAVNILYRNYTGEYAETGFLPSYEKMSELYGASVSTMRRTVSLLNQLGAARSINGKGTFICPPEEYGTEPDFSGRAIRRSLAYFVQALELIVFTCREVSWQVLPALPPERKNALLQKLELHLASGRCGPALWSVLLFIVQNSTLKGVQTICGTLFGLTLWGYPLNIGQNDPERFSQTCARLTEAIRDGLRENKMEACVPAVRELAEFIFTSAQEFLLSRGFSGEELRSAPGIKLLLND